MKKCVVLLLFVAFLFGGWGYIDASAATMDSSSSITFSNTYEWQEATQPPTVESGVVEDHSNETWNGQTLSNLPKTGDTNQIFLVWLGIGLIVLALALWLFFQKRTKHHH
ncbi:LPXTG cell wall anchor domain-containing protein [Listeria ilorinensis]|uniref:LPXTG cell wall anchor domain-containing protein n=1 Tax=Listeria ilorinensis TaxID=2867439 RepID=UPI001EF67985|nr:LPXTG cell wall anchor domain-containing protein [Listeria ilorinensis]